MLYYKIMFKLLFPNLIRFFILYISLHCFVSQYFRFDLLKIDNIIGDLSRDADVDHPIHEVEGEEHDGEDDSAVLVDITASQAEYPCWGSSRKNRSDRLGREEGGVTSSSPIPISSLVISR